ncbi:MAG: 4-(cytidine 5'-diphospho)-2-C-methyl-D-erythritol kinase [Acidimicrobiia bacterium]
MTVYQSPAKLNLALLVEPPRSDGYHPLQSLVQTIEWLDLLEVVEAEEDNLLIEGAELDPEDNLVTRSLAAARVSGSVPPLGITLRKQIPHGAGLGGGSSNAAAALLAARDASRPPMPALEEIATSIGSDVLLFLTGGTVLMSGIGEVIEPLPALAGFAVAVAVPPFEMSTPEVYRRWDELEGPVGDAIDPRRLPPQLREGIPIRNDLTPAAFDLAPRLADFMADLRSHWDGTAAMTGSGSGCFGFFADLDEAVDAARLVSGSCRAAVGARLRPEGVARDDAER